jgi:hypothetical protein
MACASNRPHTAPPQKKEKEITRSAFSLPSNLQNGKALSTLLTSSTALRPAMP